MVDIVDKALRMGEGHQLKKLENVAKAVNALEDEISALSDEDLKAQTPKFKQQIENGKSLDDIMPEAFATVREVSKRTLGQRHFDVQLMGGAALHWGNIAEMKTGEGKTLVATLPTYLNALEGKGVHVVTVNDYLASYQSELMGRIYRFLGMNVGCIITDQKPPERRKQYNADITYGTNNEFGFDYLRDNMAWEKADLVQRGHHYAIVDEVDSILIDEARTPLDHLRSGRRRRDPLVPSVRQAGPEAHPRRGLRCRREEEGRRYPGSGHHQGRGLPRHRQPVRAGQHRPDRLPQQRHQGQGAVPRVTRTTSSPRARCSSSTSTPAVSCRAAATTRACTRPSRPRKAWRSRPRTRPSPPSPCRTTSACTTSSRGMTGTAETEAAEFMNTYKLGVLPIKTNKPMIRKDQDDLIFRTKKEKLAAIVKDVAKRHAKGQPVLLGTASVESSEVVSTLLDVAKIPHQVLNAKQHEKEAAVVAVAGRKGAVTVATNMAGRGTDIMLGGNVEFLADAKLKSEGYSPEDTPEEYEKRWPGTLNEIKAQVKDEHEEVKELGGLYVLGTERHESRRIDNQLRGRSGRQGDPGESRFYLSLEDDLMRLFNTQLVAQVMAKGMEEGQPIEAKSVTKGVRTAQKAVESRNYEIRKNVLKYDDVMNKQRTVIYSERQAVLKGEDIHKDILRFISDTVESYIKGANKGSEKPKDWDWEGLFKALNTVIPTKVDEDEVRKIVGGLKGAKAVEAVRDLIVEDARQQYGEMEETIGETGLRDLERRVVLAVLDRKWREHLYEMDYLKDGIGLRGMGQRDPLVEYQREGYQMYNSMIEAIKEESVQLLFHIDVKQVASTEDAVDEVEESDETADSVTVAAGPDENGESEVEAAEGEVEEEDAKQAIAESAAVSESGESTLPVAGPAPISHAEGKVPASKRPKSDELKTPWADGRTFPGTGKNAPCPCGSGRKYKMCHGQNEK